MKLISIVFVLIISFNCVISDCSITYDPVPILDTEKDLIVIVELTENVTDFQLVKNEFSQYYKLVIDENQYKIVPTEEFQHYEENESATILMINYIINCKDGTTQSKAIAKLITDTNNHDPTFANPTYSCKLPMPFTEGIDLNPYLKMDIEITDVDLTNTKVDLTIDSSDFTIESVAPSGKKYTFKLISNKLLQYTKPQQFTLTATDSGTPPRPTTATLKIEVDEAVFNPIVTFSDAYYTFKYDKEQVELIQEKPIALKDSDKFKLAIEGANAEFFTSNYENDNVIIQLKGELPDEILKDSTYIPLSLIVNYQEEPVGKVALIIDLPYENIETTTNCPTVTTTDISCPTVTTESCECPTPDPCPTTIVTTITSPATTDTTITETCPPCPTPTPEHCTTTQVTECPIECPTTESPTTECPTTECPTTECPSTPNDCDCSTTSEPCPTIVVTEPCAETTISTTIPTTGQTETTITETCPPCPTPTPEHCPTTEATECPNTTPGDCNCNTTTECPITTTECPACPTEASTSSTQDCDCGSSQATTTPNDSTITTQTITPPPECQTTTDCDCGTTQEPTPKPGTSLEFEQRAYSATKPPDYQGELFKIRATAEPEEPIIYTTSSNIPKEISYDKDSGAVTINDYLSSGIYEFTITATGQNTNNQDTAQITITITSITICDDDEPKPFSSYLNAKVTENREATIVVFETDEGKSILDDYKYTIVPGSVYPVELTNKIKLDESYNLIVEKLDREDALFKNMYQAQCRVTLQLEKKGTINNYVNLNRTSKLEEDDQRCIIMPDKINNLKQTVVSIIIEDENDNSPQFKESNLIVGYPEEKLVAAISATSLTTVEATDADSGINAQIQYKLDTNKFIIHPTSGVIYPTDQSFDDGIKFKVTATDMNGDVNGRTGVVQIEMRLLDSKQISVLMLENVLLENLDQKLEDISKEKEIQLRPLSVSIIGNKDQKSRSQTKDTSGGFYLKVIAYALRNDKIVTSDDVIDLLPDYDVDTLETDIKESKPNKNNDDDEEDVTGYIVAISVLGVLLAAFIIIFIAIYFLKLRKPKDLIFTSGPSEPTDDDVDHKHVTSTEKNVRRQTGYVFHPPPIEEDEEDETYENNNITYIDEKSDNKLPSEEEAKERKKSVSFFSMVEKIHIEEDNDNEKADETETNAENNTEHNEISGEDERKITFTENDEHHYDTVDDTEITTL